MAESYVQYGAVKMEVVHTNSIDRTPVMLSGAAYACTQWDINIDSVYSPGDRGMSYADVGGVPTKTGGVMPANTDIEIREYLLTPRRTLLFVDNGITVLTSPNVAETRDVNNGPIVLSAKVNAIPGARAWLVSFHVQTWVRDCETRNPLIAHTWRAVVDVDGEHFATRTISGEAIFNAGVLKARNTYPDQYRRDLFHAVPRTFKRERIHVEAADDGTSLIYQIVDREMDHCYGPNCPATRIEAIETADVQSVGAIQAISPSIAGAVGNGLGVGLSALVGLIPMPGMRVAAGAGMAFFGERAINNLSSSVTATFGNVPTFKRRISVRLEGNKKAHKWHLIQLGLGIAFGRLEPPSRFMFFGLSIAHDPMGRYTEINYSTESAVEGITSFASNQAAIVRSLALKFPQTRLDELTNLSFPEGLPDRPILPGFGDPGGTMPPPPGSNGARGTWLGKMLTQAFESTNCVKPAAPRGVDSNTADLPPTP